MLLEGDEMSLTKIDDYFGVLFYKDGCTYSTIRIKLYDAVDNVWKEREINAIFTLNNHIDNRKKGHYLKDFARHFLDYGSSSKDLFMVFNERFGITIKRVVARLIFNINRHFIDPYKPYMDMICRGYAGKILPRKYIRLVDSLNYIKAIEADGLNNIAIFGVLSMSTKELRKFFGKSNWKWLCGNSRTRNYLVANAITWLLCETYEDREFTKWATRYLVTMCKSLRYSDTRNMKVNGTILRHMEELNIQPKFMANAIKLGGGIRYVSEIIKDTNRMSHILGINYDVSKAKDFITLRDKHDEFSSRITEQQQKLGDKNFSYIGKLGLEYLKHYSPNGEIYFEWVKTPNELRKVGDDQRHCVASYTSDCKHGAYMVGVIRDSSTNRILSTIGYSVRECADVTQPIKPRYDSVMYYDQVRITEQQHYAKCNTQPSLKCRELARIVEEEVLPELVQRQYKLLQVA